MQRRTILTLSVLALIAALISLWVGQQAYGWMPPQASAESILIDNLFSFLVTLGTFIFLGVTGTLIYSIAFQQAGKYEVSDGPPIEGNIKLEVVWTAIPFALAMWIAIYSYNIYDRMGILGEIEYHPDGATETAVAEGETPIQVYARQWAWEFRYPDRNVSSTELHLPVNQRAKFKLVSEDVIHGFFIPAFRVKQDVVPGEAIGFELTPIREGRYRIRDSQYSGTYFAANQTNVVVESADEYEAWLTEVAQQTPQVAENPAFDEYTQASTQPINLGWQTVEPAPPPVVNYASSANDTYE
ncbi:MAG: cytochrome c oxidase subunit II [Cyanobacteriota bacterium]|nr:cytochrome c oxidase subunit II [Cyanobacteriota bacterium]